MVFETLAHAIAFRVYRGLRRRNGDVIDDLHRGWVIAAAAMGAAIGGKALYWFGDRRLTLLHGRDPRSCSQVKPS